MTRVLHQPGFDRELTSSTSVITSDDPSQPKPKVLKENYVAHWKCRNVCFPLTVYQDLSGNLFSSASAAFRAIDEAFADPIIRDVFKYNLVELRDYFPVIDPDNPFNLGKPHEPFVPDIDSVLEKAVEKVMARGNLANFILELDDIPKMFKMIKDLPLDLSQETIRGISVGYRPWEHVSGYTLAYNLGAVPLIDDLVGMLQRILTTEENLQKSADLLATDDFVIRTGHTLDTSHDVIVGDFKYQVRETVEYKYKAVVGGKLPIYDLFSRFTGIHEDPMYVFWNALPFSFLVDYIIPVGDFYASPRVVDAHVESGCWSVKRFGYVDVYLLTADGEELLVQACAYTDYTRFPGLWDDFDDVRTRVDPPEPFYVMNPTQWQNILALCAEFLKR